MSTVSPPPYELNPGEQVVRSTDAMHLRTTLAKIGYNPLGGRAWLTNHRFHFKPTPRRRQLGINYDAVAFPLSHLTGVELVYMKVQFNNRTALRLDFDTGGREYFVLTANPEEWRESLLQAQALAPDLPYSKKPESGAAVEHARQRSWLFLAALVVGIPVACTLACLILAGIGTLIGE